MGLQAGAAAENMTAYQGHSAVNEGSGLLVTWGTIMMGGFMVNVSGNRFENETMGYSEFAVEVLKQPEKCGFLIFDQAIYDSLLSIEDFKNLSETTAFKKADTMEELGERLRIDPASLAETFGCFQRNENGQQDEFKRNSFEKKLETPYYGVKVVPALFHTQGGLKINENAQVLDEQGRIIENLYAGGGAAVGVSGRHAYGYMSGNGLLAALGFGKIAGEHAAKTITDEQGVAK